MVRATECEIFTQQKGPDLQSVLELCKSFEICCSRFADLLVRQKLRQGHPFIACVRNSHQKVEKKKNSTASQSLKAFKFRTYSRRKTQCFCLQKPCVSPLFGWFTTQSNVQGQLFRLHFRHYFTYWREKTAPSPLLCRWTKSSATPAIQSRRHTTKHPIEDKSCSSRSRNSIESYSMGLSNWSDSLLKDHNPQVLPVSVPIPHIILCFCWLSLSRAEIRKAENKMTRIDHYDHCDHCDLFIILVIFIILVLFGTYTDKMRARLLLTTIPTSCWLDWGSSQWLCLTGLLTMSYCEEFYGRQCRLCLPTFHVKRRLFVSLATVHDIALLFMIEHKMCADRKDNYIKTY